MISFIKNMIYAVLPYLALIWGLLSLVLTIAVPVLLVMILMTVKDIKKWLAASKGKK